MSDFNKFSEIPSIYMIENIINLHQERKMLFMKRVKSRIYSTQELDKRKKAIFSTQDIEQILGILYDTTGHDMSFEKQEDGTLSVTIDGTVYSVDTVQ